MDFHICTGRAPTENFRSLSKENHFLWKNKTFQPMILQSNAPAGKLNVLELLILTHYLVYRVIVNFKKFQRGIITLVLFV